MPSSSPPSALQPRASPSVCRLPAAGPPPWRRRRSWLSGRHVHPRAAHRPPRGADAKAPAAQLDLTSTDRVSLEGLEQELAKYASHEARARPSFAFARGALTRPPARHRLCATSCVAKAPSCASAPTRSRASSTRRVRALQRHAARPSLQPATCAHPRARALTSGGAGLHPGLRGRERQPGGAAAPDPRLRLHPRQNGEPAGRLPVRPRQNQLRGARLH